MKRGRDVYTETEEVRLAKVHGFIKSLKLSIPLYKLRAQQNRGTCPRCSKNRLYYCYDCLTVVHPETHPPSLKLPIDVYVLLHPGELRSKSTSLAASTISPDIHIVPYPQVPAELRPEDTLVLYPSPESVELSEVADLACYKNVVFVESTWQQSKAIVRDERVSKFKHVRIKSQSSLFWRFQNNNPSYLATVEAIYYFLREYITQSRRVSAEKAATQDGATATMATSETSASTPSGSRSGTTTIALTNETGHDSALYHGEVDDLLLYYVNQYIAIQQKYSHDATAKYTDRHFTGYILKSLDWDKLVSTPCEEQVCAQQAKASSTLSANGANGDDETAPHGAVCPP